jgi:hypothetical protein
MKSKTLEAVAPSAIQHAGWDDDDFDLEVIIEVEVWKEGEAHPFKSLWADNRGRFFLSNAKYGEDHRDLPWTAFKEVDFILALQWASHAQKYDSGYLGDCSILLDEAVRRLKAKS